MSKPLLPLCSVPRLATRDGNAGAFAKLLLPFFTDGYWFADGSVATFPGSTIAQDRSTTLGGTAKPDTYIKAAGICLKG